MNIHKHSPQSSPKEEQYSHSRQTAQLQNEPRKILFGKMITVGIYILIFTIIVHIPLYLQTKSWRILVDIAALSLGIIFLILAQRCVRQNALEKAGNFFLWTVLIAFAPGELYWRGGAIYFTSIAIVLGVVIAIIIRLRRWRLWLMILGMYILYILLINWFEPVPRVDMTEVPILFNAVPIISFIFVIVIIGQLIHVYRHTSLIRVRLSVSFVLLVLIPVAVVSALSGIVGLKTGQRQVIKQLDFVAEIEATDITKWGDQFRLDLASLSSEAQVAEKIMLLLQTPNPEEVQEFELRHHFDQAVARFTWSEELFLINPQGQVILSSNMAQEGENYGEQLYFQEELDTFSLQAVTSSPSLDGMLLLAVYPVIGPNGQIIGILAGQVNPHILHTILNETYAWAGDTGEAYLVDQNHKLLTALRFAERRDMPMDTEGVEQVLTTRGRGSGTYNDYRGIPAIVVYRWLPELQVGLLVKQDQSEALSITNSMLHFVTYLALGSIAITIVAALLMARGITRPLANLTQTATQIAAGDLALVAEVEREDELGAVAQAFNSMTTQLRELINSLEKRVAERTQDLASRTVELEALQDISLAMVSQLELDHLLQNVVELGCRLLDVKAGGIYLVDKERGDLEFVLSYGFTHNYTGTRQAPDKGLAGLVLQSGKSLIIDDYSRWEEQASKWAAESIQAAFGVPLDYKGQVIGVLVFAEKARTREFTDHEVWLMTLFANQAAIAIENARLYEDQSLRRQEAEMLRQVTAALSSTLDHNKVLDLILEKLGTLVGFDSATVMLIKGQNLSVVSAQGFPHPESVKSLTFRLEDDPLFQEIQTTGFPLILADAQTDKRFLNRGDADHVRGWMGVPMIVKGRVTGCLSMDSRHHNAFTVQDATLVQFYANQAAIAVENARLYEQAQQEIVERKRAEEHLQRTAARLEQTNHELENFVHVASHDLREPLRKVQVFGNRLQAQFGATLGDQGNNYLLRIQSGSAYAQQLLDDLLTYSRVMTRPQSCTQVHLTHVAQEIASDWADWIEQIGGRVEVGELPIVKADANQMRQLLQNLINNGLKFSRENVKPVVKVYAELLPGYSDVQGGNGASVDRHRIIVADNGIGFDAKYGDRIFRVFQRLHIRNGHGSVQNEGTGIGLAICKKIAERHGGTIEAHSTPGKGSTFMITLPVSLPDYESKHVQYAAGGLSQ